MRKNALIITCYVCVAAAFGAFFRWIQNQAGFEQDTGLVIPGSIWNPVAALVCLAAAVGLLALVLGLKKQSFAAPDTCETAFRGIRPLTDYICLLFALLMVVGGLLLFVTTKYERYHVLLRLLAVLTVAAGLGYPHIMSAPEKQREPAMLCLCAALPVLLCSYWLVVSYKLHGAEPSAWAYGFDALAIGFNAIGFYYLAGYAFGRVHTYRTLFFSLLGAFFALVTMGDEQFFAMKLMLLACAGMQMLSCGLVVSNMRVPQSETAEEE